MKKLLFLLLITSSVSAQRSISLKVAAVDTGLALTNYIRTANYGTIKTGQALGVDTTLLSTKANVTAKLIGYADAASYVPYTGATTNLNFGTRTLASGAITSSGGISGTTGTFSGITSITDATNPTTSSNGALVVTGGLGVGGNAIIAGPLTIGTVINTGSNSLFAGNGTFTGTLTSPTASLTSTGAVLSSTGTSTSSRYLNIANTSGQAQFGVEGSVGGTTWTGSTAYATVTKSTGNVQTIIGTTKILDIASTGATVTGTLNSGAITSSSIITVDGATTNPSLIMLNTGGNRWELYPDATTFGIFNRTGSYYPLKFSNATGAATFNSTVTLAGYTVATLPTGTVGMIAYVTDATAPTYNGTLTGGGTVKTLVFYDGTAWKSH